MKEGNLRIALAYILPRLHVTYILPLDTIYMKAKQFCVVCEGNDHFYVYYTSSPGKLQKKIIRFTKMYYSVFNHVKL